MLCLPNTYNTNDWTSNYDLVDKASTGILPLQTEVVLSLLSTEDVEGWFAGASKNGSLQAAKTIAYWMPRYWQPVFEAMALAIFDPENTGQVTISYNDLPCRTCDVIVHKAIDSEHWDSLCSTCYHHSEDCSCCLKCGYEECECCQTCGEAPGWCECCSYCQEPLGDCSCDTCRNCGETVHYCSCNSGGESHTFGSTKAAPWLAREDSPIADTLPKIGDCDNGSIDPVQAAANFYLLDAIKSGVRFSQVVGADDRLHAARPELTRQDSMLSALTVSATREYERLVEYLAPNFLAYSIAAVGGELRYHKACGKGVLTSSRDTAWDRFVDIVQEKGPETLFEADKLFREFGGGAYGGKKWGDAAKIVGQYLKGSMPDWLFVDRVFTLQHNGGCFLNKVNWKKKGQHRIGLSKMQYILDAHAADDTDWDLLLAVASPEVAQMFRMTDRAIGRLSKRFGGLLPPVRPTRQRHILRREYD